MSEKESSGGESESVGVKSSVCQVRKKKKKRSDPGGGRTHDLSLRRRMRFHCATGPSMKIVKKSLMKGSQTREEEREGKKGLRRESNPGHPHPKRVFYHLTTKPSDKGGKKA